MLKRIGIIGGGAAGLFAACMLKRYAAGPDIDISIIEKNPVPGNKLILTGHGRCNITNRKPASELKKGYHEADRFLYPALKEFGPEDTIRFFEDELGLKTKEEDNNRIFPVCDSAVKVRDSIVSYLSGSVRMICGSKVLDIRKTSCFEVTVSGMTYNFDVLILSCGGRSFPQTGSAGDSYRFAERFGHTVIPARAALAPVKVNVGFSAFSSALSGVTVTADISVYCNGRKSASCTGELLFAEFGLTMSDEQFDTELQRQIGEHPGSKISTLLSGYMPASAACEICSEAGADGLYAQNFTRENRKRLICKAKHLRLGIDQAPSIDKAYVTRGGVSLKEIDRKTFGSRLVPGLYITGEALDIDGISGGYNLQACMSEAYMAAKDILGQ